MKTLITTLLLIANVTFAGDVADQTDVLNAQVRVTHDTLQQVLTKMRNAPGTQEVYANPDFVDAAKRFNDLAESAMIKFEKTLKEEILPQIALLINRLDSIYKSASFNKDQKSILLKQQYELAKEKMGYISYQYRNAIYQLYVVDLPEAKAQEKWTCDIMGKGGKYSYEISFADKSLGTFETKPVHHASLCEDKDHKSTSFEIYAYETNRWNIKNIIFDKSIRQHCLSQSCIGLLFNHRHAYLSEIRQKIDILMRFNFADVNFFQLSSGDISGDYIIGYQNPPFLLLNTFYRRETKDVAFDENISFYLQSNINDIRGLPFDISPDEYNRIKQSQKRN